MIIKGVKARVIYNSRKEKTIEVIINKKFIGSAPSGASKSKKEVNYWPNGGVKRAVSKLNKCSNLIGLEIKKFSDLKKVERIVKPKEYGGNTVIALESAILKAASNGRVWNFLNPKARSFPRFVGNVVGGGAHSKKGTDFQEFLLIPKTNIPSRGNYLLKHTHKRVGSLLRKYGKKFFLRKTDEGAWSPELSTLEVINLVYEAINSNAIYLGVDIAGDSFYKKGKYNYKNFAGSKEKINKKQQINFVNFLIKKYKLKYVEDPVQEKDVDGYKKINQKAIVVGDDLTSTNPKVLKKVHKNISGIIIKPNQIGSLIKTKEVMDLAKKYKLETIISHRSGETMDTLISHLAFAWGADYIKCGIYGKERQAKIKELIKIYKEVKN